MRRTACASVFRRGPGRRGARVALFGSGFGSPGRPLHPQRRHGTCGPPTSLRGRLVVAGRAPQHAALPVGRAACRLPNGREGGLAETAEEAANRLGLGDQRHEAHAPAAGRTRQNVDREAALEELSPGPVARARDGSLGRLGARLGVVGRRRHLGHDARTELARGSEHARVANGMELRRGHRCGQAAEERQGVHVHGDGAVGEPEWTESSSLDGVHGGLRSEAK